MKKYNTITNDANRNRVSKQGFIFIIVALALITLSVVMNKYWGDDDWTHIVVPIVSTIASIFGLSAVWELLAKYSFAKQIVALANISANIQTSGIVQYTNNFKDINWDDELKHTKNLYVVVTYADTWRNQNCERLKKFVASGGKIKIALPNVENSTLMEEYDRRYNFSKGETIKKVQNAEKEFEKIKAEIYHYGNAILNSFYFMDNYAVMAPFNHSKTRDFVPAIKAEKGGELYDFIQKEISAIFGTE